MSDLLNRVGRSAFSYLASGTGEAEDGFVGSVGEVDGLQVQVTRLLGEGGYAFIYSAKELTSGGEFALKRFLVFEESKVAEVVAEIRLIKELKEQGDVVSFVTAASVDHSQGKKVNKEFLLLMELCSGGDLAQMLRRGQAALSPPDACLVLACLARSLAALHTRSPAVTHRDIKLENLLVTADGAVKLCDLGSATTAVHSPGPDWNMNQRTVLEDELAKYSTPMYRAPEMCDTWSNFPINQAVDIWAAGLVLYAVCFNKHPFEDSNKLAIVNGNYRIPGGDSRYKMFHPLIHSMLSLDPRARPTAPQLLEQVAALAETQGWRTRGPLEGFTVEAAGAAPPPALPEGPVVAAAVAAEPAANNVTSLKASAGSLFSRLKDSSRAMVASVQQSMIGR
jgi:cyclin G-associated kinase